METGDSTILSLFSLSCITSPRGAGRLHFVFLVYVLLKIRKRLFA